jgi:hypothetical protein
MNKFFKLKMMLPAVLTVVFLAGCSLFDLDINKNPNAPLVAAPDLILTQIQTNVLSTFGGFEGTLETFNGFMGTQATSLYNINANSYSGTWNALYTGPLKDLEGLIAASQQSPHYLGIAQILKAYTYSTMVDLWGDVPFLDAGKGDLSEKNIAPKFDKDADIYNACLTLLDQGIANLAKTTPAPVNGDLMYGGAPANYVPKWTKFANSVKLKMLVSARLAITDAPARVKAILDGGNFITANADDFIFRYSRDLTSIRHPWYEGAYSGGEFAFTYICHQPVVEMLDEEDPRFPFYFRRQTKAVLNPADPAEAGTIPCGRTSACTYGYLLTSPNVIKRLYTDKNKVYDQAARDFMAGLFGRDRGDNTGIPADGPYRLLPGVYPCGGYYDVAVAALPIANRAPGGGIFPAMTSVNTEYYKIEAMLKMGYAGDATAVLKSAMTQHINNVVNYGMATDPNSVRPTQAAIDNYIKLWTDRFTNAATADAKLGVALKQLWFSSYGNGFDFYNAFRRTGLPSTIQEHIVKPIRGYPLRLPYTQTELTLNPNAASYKDVAFDKAPIFWDK